MVFGLTRGSRRDKTRDYSPQPVLRSFEVVFAPTPIISEAARSELPTGSGGDQDKLSCSVGCCFIAWLLRLEGRYQIGDVVTILTEVSPKQI
jgi:hypothetical protein